MRVPILVPFVALALAGCNANQAINPSGRTSARAIPAAIPTIPRATPRTTSESAAKSRTITMDEPVDSRRRRSSQDESGLGVDRRAQRLSFQLARQCARQVRPQLTPAHRSRHAHRRRLDLSARLRRSAEGLVSAVTGREGEGNGSEPFRPRAL
jgi:hypothetical protein